MMMSNPQHRLTSASEAWARLFRNARPITPRQPQQPRRASTQDTSNMKNTPGTIRLPTNTQQPHQDGNTIPTLTITQTASQQLKDNVTWGDEVTEKQPQITRIYSQNVNGIRFEKDGGQFNELCKIHQEVQADVLCIQEHNLDTTQHTVKHTIHQVCHKSWQRVLPESRKLIDPIHRYMETRGDGNNVY